MSAETSAIPVMAQTAPQGNTCEEDQALVYAAQSGDLAAFDRLVERHQAGALRFALKLLSDSESAREVCIVAFGNAFRGLAGYHGTASFATWFFRILVRECSHARRSKRRDQQRYVAPEALPPGWEPADATSLADPRGMAAEHELEQRLREAIARLPHRLRTVWLLYAGEGMSIEQIAGICQLPAGTVKSRLHHGRRQLAHALAPYLEQLP